MHEKEKSQYQFSADVLKVIIDKNLTLFQYYEHLYPLLQAASIEHQKNKSKRSSLFVDNSKPVNHLKSNPNEARFRIKQQTFSYNLIDQCLSSKDLIEKINPYINSLLTSTNIGIVRETLKIYMILETNVDRSRALQRIRMIVNILTLYQLEKNVTCIYSDLNELNSIFSKIGLIIHQSQFQYYYNSLWSGYQLEAVQIGHSMNSKRSIVKLLQIHDLLSLGIQMQEINNLRENLREWMSSEQFLKFHMSKFKAINSDARVQEKLIKQNLNVTKHRIQYFGPEELLKQVLETKFDLKKQIKCYHYFREQRLYQYQAQIYKNKQNNPTKCFSLENNNAFMSGGTKNIKNNKSNNEDNFTQSQIQKPMQETRQKVQQELFNHKVLNGEFTRQQILEDLQSGNVNFIEDIENFQHSTFSIDLKSKTLGSLFRMPLSVFNSSKRQDNIYSKTGQQNNLNTSEMHLQINLDVNKQVHRISNFYQTSNPTENHNMKTTSFIHQGQCYNGAVTICQTQKQNSSIRGTFNFYIKKMEKIRNQPFFGIGNR